MGRTAAIFDFEGEQLTVAEICLRVPALTDASVRAHLRAGRNTTQAMLTYNHTLVRQANGRKAAKNKNVRVFHTAGRRSSDDR